jgi:hypothetical protein
MATTLDQLTYRFRKDDGVEAGATWLGVEGEATPLFANEYYRVRFRVVESGGTAWTGGSAKLYYSLDDSTYAAAGANTPIEVAGSKYYADGDDTTDLLTSEGTLTTNNNGMASDDLTATVTCGANEEAEIEYCFKLVRTGNLKNGDPIYLKVYNNTSALDSYTLTGTITLVVPGGGGGRRK